MPMYDYECGRGHKFETMNRVDERHTATCECGSIAKMLISAPRIDPRMDTPGAVMKFRKDAMKRGRGADMTGANKSVEDYGIRKDAWQARQDNGEGKIIVS